MKFKLPSIFIFIVGMALGPGCTQYQKVQALETTVTTPYESLGTLEVKAKALKPRPQQVLWAPVEMLTLGFAKTPSQADDFKKELDKQLVDKARKHYGADMVVNVRYWPPLDSSSFPKGTVYARGDMIRYLPFEEGFYGESQPAAG